MALVFLAANPSSGEDVAIDLARDHDVTRTVSPGVPLHLVIINRIPNVRYAVRVERVPVDIPPYPLAAVRVAERTSICGTFGDAIAALRNETQDEVAVSKLAAQVEVLLPLASAAACDAALLAQARESIDATRHELGTYSLELGEELRVTITRGGIGTAPVPDPWKAVFTTGPRGAWVVSYGFAFAHDDDERYFSQPAGENKFKIVPETDRRDLAFMPAVFFSWLPKRQQLRDWSLNLTGGLGFDQTAPTVFVGPSVTYNRNLMLVGGLSVRRHARLRGQYKGTGDEEVGENLTPDQLHEHTYMPRGFAALTFRFDGNPFKKEETKKVEDSKETPKAKEKAGESKAARKATDKPPDSPQQ